jgi:formylglycine-generating enzyme required for sulfatase activity
MGEQWPEAIDRGLEESSVVVVALTSDALTSAWVRKETFAAIHLESLGQITFIPLDVAECEPPILWRTYQFAPFRKSYTTGLSDLLARLSGAPVDRRIHEKTGIELIRIPAGPFLFGSSDADKMAYDDEKPQRTIDLPEYWIGRYSVTNAQFARFVKAKNYRTTAEQQGFGWAWTGSNWEQVKGADWRHPSGPKSDIGGKNDHPVVQVSWNDAQAFCDWAGLVLPTEQQWEKAARGAADGRLWPWGDDEPTDKHCNLNLNVGDTTPVGHYSPLGDSPYGCADMAGNVWEFWEWTASPWEPDSDRRVLRGGAWGDDQRDARVSVRSGSAPDVANFSNGFCLAAPVDSGS